MNKQEFLAAIRERIAALPVEDIQKSLEYYDEMISDRMEDGVSEEQAVTDMGMPEEIAAQILLDTPLPKLVKTTLQPARQLAGWEIALLILGFPVWFPLLLAAVIVILAVYIVLWSAVIVLYAADVVFWSGAVAGILGSMILLFTQGLPQALLFFGAGLICSGMGLLWIFVCNSAAKGAIVLGKWILRGIKRLFIRKGEPK